MHKTLHDFMFYTHNILCRDNEVSLETEEATGSLVEGDNPVTAGGGGKKGKRNKKKGFED